MMINVSNNNFFCFFIQISISMNKNNVGCEIQWIQLLIYRILNSHRAQHIQTIIIIIIIIIFILFTRMHNQLIIFFSDMNTHTNKEKKIRTCTYTTYTSILGMCKPDFILFSFFLYFCFLVSYIQVIIKQNHMHHLPRLLLHHYYFLLLLLFPSPSSDTSVCLSILISRC